MVQRSSTRPPRVIVNRAGIVSAWAPSASKPGTAYLVVCIDGVAACSCPGWIMRGNCRHATEVEALAIELGRQARDVAAAPTSATRRTA